MNLNGVPQLVAILRGISPNEIEEVSQYLYDAGFRYIEVPLNSPDAFISIERLVQKLGHNAFCGAGTVTCVDEVERLNKIGANLVVTPNCNPLVIKAGLKAGMTVIPGVVTPTEAFAAIEAGAQQLKLFPVADFGPGYIKNLKAVLPATLKVFAVGGVNAGNMDALYRAGANGFGLGSDLYRPGDDPAVVGERARKYVTLLKTITE